MTATDTKRALRRAREFLLAYAGPADLEAYDAAISALSSQPEALAVVSAKPLDWSEEEEHPSEGWKEWGEPMMGFRIEFDPEELPDARYTATWGEGDSCAFATLDEAKQWCQEQADAWVRDCAQGTTPPPDAALRELVRDFTNEVKGRSLGMNEDKNNAYRYCYERLESILSRQPAQGDDESATCAECGVQLELVRPGKHQHPTCSQAQPDGVVVPREPTPEMVEAGAASIRCDCDPQHKPQRPTAHRAARNAFVSMLEAASRREGV